MDEYGGMGPGTGGDGGGDWSSGGGGELRPAAQQPQGPPGQRGHGLLDGIGELDDSTALFQDIQINIKSYFSRIKGPMLKAFAAASAISLIVAAIKFVVNIGVGVAGAAGAVVAILGTLMMLMMSLVAVFAWVFQASLYRPAHHAMMVSDTPAPQTLKEAANQAMPALVPALLTTLLLGFASGLGSMCCLIPGVVVYILLAPSRYLAVARGMSIGDAINASMDIGKKYWLVMALTLLLSGAAMSVAMGIAGGIGGVIGFMAGAVTSSVESPVVMSIIIAFTQLFADVIRWFFGLLGGVALWSIEGGVMSTLEAEEFADTQIRL